MLTLRFVSPNPSIVTLKLDEEAGMQRNHAKKVLAKLRKERGNYTKQACQTAEQVG